MHLFAQAGLARREGRLADAEAIFRSMLRKQPTSHLARYGLSLILLTQGRYEEGWKFYESRGHAPQTGVKKPALSFPEWRGEPIRSLAIWPEQGIGDQIMFARYVPALVARGVDVTIYCAPPLVRLFNQLGVKVVAAEGGVRIAPHDAWCLIMSLAQRSTPYACPYLGSGNATGTGVGVMVRGNPTHYNDRVRSMFGADAASLLALGRDLSPENTGAADFQDTAEIIAGLELVITVDTSVAHLAGAMGKPTWLLVDSDPDWRWGQVGDGSRWYPSMRLFRQARGEGWPPVIDRIKTALQAR